MAIMLILMIAGSIAVIWLLAWLISLPFKYRNDVKLEEVPA